jgi:hypothetical protein
LKDRKEQFNLCKQTTLSSRLLHIFLLLEGWRIRGYLDVFCVFQGVFDFEARLLLDTQFASEPDV